MTTCYRVLCRLETGLVTPTGGKAESQPRVATRRLSLAGELQERLLVNPRSASLRSAPTRRTESA